MSIIWNTAMMMHLFFRVGYCRVKYKDTYGFVNINGDEDDKYGFC